MVPRGERDDEHVTSAARADQPQRRGVHTQLGAQLVHLFEAAERSPTIRLVGRDGRRAAPHVVVPAGEDDLVEARREHSQRRAQHLEIVADVARA